MADWVRGMEKNKMTISGPPRSDLLADRNRVIRDFFGAGPAESAMAPAAEFAEQKFRSPDAPRVVQVIIGRTHRGQGTELDPHRMAIEIHDIDGHMIAERDPVDVGARRMCRDLAKMVEVEAALTKRFQDVYAHNEKLTIENRDLKNKLRRLQRAKR